MLSGLGCELRLALGLEAFEYFTVLVLMAANTDGLGQSVQAHLLLAVVILLVYIWTNHKGPFIGIAVSAGYAENGPEAPARRL